MPHARHGPSRPATRQSAPYTRHGYAASFRVTTMRIHRGRSRSDNFRTAADCISIWTSTALKIPIRVLSAEPSRSSKPCARRREPCRQRNHPSKLKHPQCPKSSRKATCISDRKSGTADDTHHRRPARCTSGHWWPRLRATSMRSVMTANGRSVSMISIRHGLSSARRTTYCAH